VKHLGGNDMLRVLGPAGLDSPGQVAGLGSVKQRLERLLGGYPLQVDMHRFQRLATQAGAVR
jgi:hypothetical protein